MNALAAALIALLSLVADDGAEPSPGALQGLTASTLAPAPLEGRRVGAFWGRVGSRLFLVGGEDLGDPGLDGEPVPAGAPLMLDLDAASPRWERVRGPPIERAFGVGLADDQGLLCLGGRSLGRDHRSVTRLSWNGLALESLAWPELPAALGQAPAAWCAPFVVVFPEVDGPGPAGPWVLDTGRLEDGWSSGTPCPRGPRSGGAAAAMVWRGRPAALLAGGDDGDDDGDGARRDAWLYLPGEDRWQAVADVPEPRRNAAMVAHGPAHALLIGGRREPGAPMSATPLAWYAVTDRWAPLADLAYAPSGISLLADAAGPLQLAGFRVDDQSDLPVTRLVPERAGDAALGDTDLTVLVTYLVLVLGVGLFAARRQRSGDDYFLAGRRIPWWAAGLSLYGTQLSAITFMTTPALAFATDLRYAPTWIAVFAIAPVVGRWYIPVLRRLEVRTAYEYLERRFSRGVRRLGSATFITYQLARMAVVVFLPSLALAVLTGLDTGSCILVTGLAATLYTVVGGMAAVVWTDVLQVVVLMGGVLAALFLALSDIGGLAGLSEVAGPVGKLRLWDGGFSLTDEASWSLLIGAFFLQFGPYTTDQAFVQRYLSTPDERSAVRGIWLNGTLALPALAIFPTLGVVLWAWYAQRPEAVPLGMRHDEVVPAFIAGRLPAGLAGLVVAALFAATMSSLDSAMHSVAASLTQDWRRRSGAPAGGAASADGAAAEAGPALGRARLWTVVAGLAGTGAAFGLATLQIPLLFLFFQMLVGLLASGTAAMFVLGITTRRVGPRGAVAAVIASAVAVGVARLTGLHTFWFGAAGLGVGCLVGWLVGLTERGRQADAAT